MNCGTEVIVIQIPTFNKTLKRIGLLVYFVILKKEISIFSCCSNSILYVLVRDI